MLENLINLVKENASEAIINNSAIPNEHNDAAIETTANSIMDTLKNKIGGGGIESVTSLFTGNSSEQSDILNSITQNVSSSLSQKLGVSSVAAGSIAQQLIPTVMSKLVQKTNDPNDSSFDLNGLLASLTTAGSVGNITGMLGKIFG